MLNTLTESEVIERLPVVVFCYVIKPDGRAGFRYMSSASQNILGLSPDELHSTTKKIRDYIHPRGLAGI